MDALKRKTLLQAEQACMWDRAGGDTHPSATGTHRFHGHGDTQAQGDRAGGDTHPSATGTHRQEGTHTLRPRGLTRFVAMGTHGHGNKQAQRSRRGHTGHRFRRLGHTPHHEFVRCVSPNPSNPSSSCVSPNSTRRSCAGVVTLICTCSLASCRKA